MPMEQSRCAESNLLATNWLLRYQHHAIYYHYCHHHHHHHQLPHHDITLTLSILLHTVLPVISHSFSSSELEPYSWSLIQGSHTRTYESDFGRKLRRVDINARHNVELHELGSIRCDEVVLFPEHSLNVQPCLLIHLPGDTGGVQPLGHSHGEMK